MAERVAVFGLGYVGTVTAACLSRDGHTVVGVDIDPGKTSAIARGESPVAEPGVEELLSAAVSAGRLTTTTSVDEAVSRTEIAMIAVGTPSDSRGDVDVSALMRVVEQIGACLRGTDREYIIVIRSTLLPPLVEELLIPALEAALGEPAGERVHLCNNPEFLREATAVRDYDSPPFIVVGANDEEAANRVLELYARIPAPSIATDLKTAALVKYACNAFHALKVAFANEIGVLSRAMGADGREVMEIVCRDERLNISPAYLRPGFAFGGSCLPKDLRALTRFADRDAVPTEVLRAILPSNEALLAQGVRLVQERAGVNRRIGLIGLSFKAGTDDLRESPQVRLAEILIGRGFDLRIYDPGVETARLVGRNRSYVEQHLPHLAALLVPDVGAVFHHADLLVLGTDVANHVAWATDYFGEVVDLRRDLISVGQELALIGK
ncbi:MAG: nucleotide sugar dehydrogenase [Planctomycetaceae bacterium]